MFKYRLSKNGSLSGLRKTNDSLVLWVEEKNESLLYSCVRLVTNYVISQVNVNLLSMFDKTSSLQLNYREMETANFIGDGEQKPLEELLFSAGLTAGLHGQLTFISVLNIFLSITAFLGNALILADLRMESSLHPLSKLLLHSLATTDFCVGLILDQSLSILHF